MLPENSDKPVLIWLPVEDECDEDDDDYTTEAQIDFSQDLSVPSHDRKIGLVMPAADSTILGPNSPKEEFESLVCGKKGCGELLGHSITMMMREDQSTSPLNKCLAALAGDIALRFCGLIVLLRQSKVENPSITFDITTADFTLALDALTEYDKKTNGNGTSAVGLDVRKKIPGVKMSQNPQRLEVVEVPVRHPAFTSGALSEVTRITKFPIRIQKYSARTPVAKASSDDDDKDINVNALCICLEASPPNFCKIATTFPTEDGPVLLVNGDRRPLTISKLKKMCNIIKGSLQSVLFKCPKEDRAFFIKAFEAKWAGIVATMDAAHGNGCVCGECLWV